MFWGQNRAQLMKSMQNVILTEDSTFEQYVVKLLNDTIMRVPPVVTRASIPVPQIQQS